MILGVLETDKINNSSYGAVEVAFAQNYIQERKKKRKLLWYDQARRALCLIK
jgi:hypothetical protein